MSRRKQHEKLKRIADFKKAKITHVGVGMAAEYIERFMDKHGEVMAKQLFFCNLTESDLRSDSPVV